MAKNNDQLRKLVLAVVLLVGLGLVIAVAQRPHASGTLTVGIISDPVTLDPAFMASFFELSTQYLIHEPLLHITPSLEFEPGLAESWSIENDLVYTFVLREGLTFHDGTPIDSQAAKWNFDRMLNPETGSPRRGELGPIVEVDIIDERTFRLILSEPYAPLLAVLTNRAGMLVSPTAFSELGEDFGNLAVGAGPFKVVRWVKNSELVLERFENYWRGGQPFLDRVVLRPLPDETVRLTNLRSGSLQLIDGVPPQNVAGLRADTNLNLFEKPGLGFNGFALNTTRPPFNDVRVRQALWYSIDPNVIHQVVFFGTGAVSYGPIPPSIPWAYDADFRPYEYNLARARELLQEAGLNRVAFEITVTNAPIQVRTAEIIQAQAAEAGFDITIRQIDATSLISVLRQRDFDASWAPWSGRVDPDGNTFHYFSIGGSNNFAGYENEEIDRLLRQARSTLDQDKRGALYKEVTRLLAESAPYIFLHHDASLQATTQQVDNFRQWPDGALHLESVVLGN